MSNILNGFTISGITGNVTAVLSAIGPALTLLVGILLAFLVITNIVEIIQKKDK